MKVERMDLCVCVTQLCPTLCNPLDCSPPGSSVHEILQARILEWVAIPFSTGSSQPRHQTRVSHFAVRFFTIWATWEAWTFRGEVAEFKYWCLKWGFHLGKTKTLDQCTQPDFDSKTGIQVKLSPLSCHRFKEVYPDDLSGSSSCFYLFAAFSSYGIYCIHFFSPLQKFSWDVFLESWPECKCLHSHWDLALPHFLPLPFFCSKGSSDPPCSICLQGGGSWSLIILHWFPSQSPPQPTSETELDTDTL